MLNVSTQNVGGLGLEVRNRQRKGVTGPKLQYLRHCVNIENTDVLVLTETRARTTEESQATYIKKSGLAVTMCTSSGRAAAGDSSNRSSTAYCRRKHQGIGTHRTLHIRGVQNTRDAYNSWGGIFG